MQIVLLKSNDGADVELCKEVKGNMYDMVVEGFQLLSRWTGRIWEQCAWKFSRPCKDVPAESHEISASVSDYEKVFVLQVLSEVQFVVSFTVLSDVHASLFMCVVPVNNHHQ